MIFVQQLSSLSLLLSSSPPRWAMPHSLLCMLSSPQCSCLSVAEVAVPSQAGSAHPFMPLLLPAFALLTPDTFHYRVTYIA